MKSFLDSCGTAVLILAICFGLSYCEKTVLENKKARIEIEQMQLDLKRQKEQKPAPKVE